jgi:hypothetical protein
LAGAIVMLFFFLARVVVFVWRFVFSYPLPEVIFYLFGYLLPELLPAAMHTYVMRQRKRAGSEGTNCFVLCCLFCLSIFLFQLVF